MPDLVAQKSSLRKMLSTRRADAHKTLKNSAPDAVAVHVRAIAGDLETATASAFYPYLSEIDTRPALQTLADTGWKTALPVVEGEGLPLTFRAWVPGGPTEPGAWNIPIPPKSAETVSPDLMLVPLLAFDRAGYRLGYGGGFYDRTIAALRKTRNVTTVGVAYAAQEVDIVPHDGHDARLDWIVTEAEALRITASEGV